MFLACGACKKTKVSQRKNEPVAQNSEQKPLTHESKSFLLLDFDSGVDPRILTSSQYDFIAQELEAVEREHEGAPPEKGESPELDLAGPQFAAMLGRRLLPVARVVQAQVRIGLREARISARQTVRSAAKEVQEQVLKGDKNRLDRAKDAYDIYERGVAPYIQATTAPSGLVSVYVRDMLKYRGIPAALGLAENSDPETEALALDYRFFDPKDAQVRPNLGDLILVQHEAGKKPLARLQVSLQEFCKVMDLDKRCPARSARELFLVTGSSKLEETLTETQAINPETTLLWKLDPAGALEHVPWPKVQMPKEVPVNAVDEKQQ